MSVRDLSMKKERLDTNARLEWHAGYGMFSYLLEGALGGVR